jgi:hypothetical protein
MMRLEGAKVMISDDTKRQKEGFLSAMALQAFRIGDGG